MKIIKPMLNSLLLLNGLVLLVNPLLGQDRESFTSPHSIVAPKLIVDDLGRAENFYKTFLGVKEINRIDSNLELFDETILGYGQGANIALYEPNPNVERPLPKSQHPVVLFNTPHLRAITDRLEATGYPVRYIGSETSEGLFIGITEDPAGNVVEIVSRGDTPNVGGSKLIVSNRKEAEDFYSRVFNVPPLRYYKSDSYDEVLMNFGEGPFLALFESKVEPQLTKSQAPVVAIATSDYDGVVSRLKQEGVEMSEIVFGALTITIAQDPSGNAIEIIRR
ncbi:MAG: VOC family protein [Proteobacteria bacterium]|nr:VOC family protein [Pseudomonadota bacterium]